MWCSLRENSVNSNSSNICQGAAKSFIKKDLKSCSIVISGCRREVYDNLLLPSSRVKNP